MFGRGGGGGGGGRNGQGERDLDLVVYRTYDHTHPKNTSECLVVLSLGE